MHILLLLLGFFLLYHGAETLVSSASSIALQRGVKKIVVGLTIVAMGTSLPEFVVSTIAAVNKVDDVSIGNIVGSNIANILLVLGLAVLIRPVRIRKRVIILEMPFLITLTILFVYFCWDGTLGRIDGLLLLGLFLGYIGFIWYNRKVSSEILGEQEIEARIKPILKNLLGITLGLGELLIGGQITVKGAIGLAQLLGISEVVIGLTVVAVGTSLPELFTSIVAAAKGEHEISLGNVIGSNLFNIGQILGIVSLIHPLKVAGAIIKFDNWVMLFVTILMGVIVLVSFLSKRVTYLGRLVGVLFLSIYTLFVLNLVFDFV